jgi:hypothetical protein
LIDPGAAGALAVGVVTLEHCALTQIWEGGGGLLAVVWLHALLVPKEQATAQSTAATINARFSLI